MQLYQTLKIYKDALELSIYVHKVIIEFNIYSECNALWDNSIKIKDCIVNGFAKINSKQHYCKFLNDALKYTFTVQEEIDLLEEHELFDSDKIYSKLHLKYKNLAKDIYLLRKEILNGHFSFDVCYSK